MPNARCAEVELAAAAALAREHWGLCGELTPLPSYVDRNFRLTTAGGDFVLKIANPDEDPLAIEFECAVQRAVAGTGCPELVPSATGDDVVAVDWLDGTRRAMRVVTFLRGAVLAEARPFSPALLRDLGRVLAEMDARLEGFAQPGMHRDLRWDLRHATRVVADIHREDDVDVRAALEHCAVQFRACVEPRMDELRQGVTHNDGNDYNVLVDGDRVVGLIDFGDATHTCTVFNLAIAGAYVVLDTDAPIAQLAELVRGYHDVRPLDATEIEVLFPALCMRLCVSVVLAGSSQREDPDNDYIAISQRPVREALVRLRELDPFAVRQQLRAACDLAQENDPVDHATLESRRAAAVGPSLSLSYEAPLHIVRGQGQYLFDARGRGYVDCVNNVCHVGHCHPRVVAAASAQQARLNTNTRYLHEHLVDYAERLVALFPEPLDTCFFVCTGSEANELAVRLARTFTGRHDMVVLDVAYHGNTSTLIELSPYKHDGPGGAGRPDHVHVAALPDSYRGEHRGVDAAPRYAHSVRAALERAAEREASGGGAAAFLVESMSGCGGQVEFPPGYLQAAFGYARDAGALCIADEVQVGFGRVGSDWWAFETQDVVPDIVTLGKPIGNGHPLAAVVTRRDIAAAFANGMEYFNTFGGNPVSCAVGQAVLDVIEDEGLRENAAVVGAQLLAGFRSLQRDFPILGDVRGRGLFLGVEFVRDGAPAAAELREVVERMKAAGFLLSTDGRDHNVLKLKPPLCFAAADAAVLLSALARVLRELGHEQKRVD